MTRLDICHLCLMSVLKTSISRALGITALMVDSMAYQGHCLRWMTGLSLRTPRMLPKWDGRRRSQIISNLRYTSGLKKIYIL
ncbi:hypothetical protein MBAV_000513 [Candidatus Magnetobacterium bavaricum]|uniref:Uncharacterized protein n=1 Tax=Candidatus Magnetobacterium bavaricum TaxID=29290 RepID=A0A0F3H300_9BACT|nr:hypothetical protein MBAV_000513 [Candidatus Magnetobacterium bavaricum]